MRSLSLDLRQTTWPIVFITLGCLPLLWSALRHFDGMQWFGIALLPFILKAEKGVTGNNFYLGLSILFSLLYLTLGQYYWTFAAGLSIIYHLINTRIGRLNSIAFYTIIFYLPLTRSFFMLFGFHVRIQITKWAGWVLSLVNDNVSFLGSRIWVDGNEFTVDAGCMGLRLVITGFILSLLIMQQLAKRYNVKPDCWFVSSFLLVSLVLVIAANFFRILLTIQFQSCANSWSHELIGLSTFLVFHLVPMYMLVRKFIPKIRQDRELSSRKVASNGIDLWLMGMLVSLMLAKSIYSPNGARFTGKEGLVKNIKGYELNVSRDGVHKYSSSNSTLIVKPMFPLSFSNHHPMLCWRADGFDVIGESLTKLGETDCYRANLQRDDQQLQTAWWYVDEDGNKTTSEWEWRWSAISKKKQYFLVNLAATSEDHLLFSSVETKNGQLAFERIK